MRRENKERKGKERRVTRRTQTWGVGEGKNRTHRGRGKASEDRKEDHGEKKVELYRGRIRITARRGDGHQRGVELHEAEA